MQIVDAILIDLTKCVPKVVSLNFFCRVLEDMVCIKYNWFYASYYRIWYVLDRITLHFRCCEAVQTISLANILIDLLRNVPEVVSLRFFCWVI